MHKQHYIDTNNQNINRCPKVPESIMTASRCKLKFPPGHITSSPQFIPRRNGKKPTDGYIICTVWHENKNEFWLFDANNLSKSPQCKLSYPSMNFAFTLHTAWLPTIESRQASYYINVREDYNKLVHEASQKHPDITDLFEQEIYPHFD